MAYHYIVCHVIHACRESKNKHHSALHVQLAFHTTSAYNTFIIIFLNEISRENSETNQSPQQTLLGRYPACHLAFLHTSFRQLDVIHL